MGRYLAGVILGSCSKLCKVLSYYSFPHPIERKSYSQKSEQPLHVSTSCCVTGQSGGILHRGSWWEQNLAAKLWVWRKSRPAAFKAKAAARRREIQKKRRSAQALKEAEAQRAGHAEWSSLLPSDPPTFLSGRSFNEQQVILVRAKLSLRLVVRHRHNCRGRPEVSRQILGAQGNRVATPVRAVSVA
jgi:hypothetical protein